jgi:hypothetical protein
MYQRIPCEPVVDPLGSAVHTLGTVDIEPSLKTRGFSVGSEALGFVVFKFHHCLQAAPLISEMHFTCDDQFCQLIFFKVNCT